MTSMRATGRAGRIVLAAAALAMLASCGGGGSGLGSSGNLFGGGSGRAAETQAVRQQAVREEPRQSTIWDLFTNASDPNTTVEVNKYLWQASLEILNFLPIQSVNPFSGVIEIGRAHF